MSRKQISHSNIENMPNEGAYLKEFYLGMITTEVVDVNSGPIFDAEIENLNENFPCDPAVTNFAVFSSFMIVKVKDFKIKV